MARPQNLEARERILGAALELFHEHGYKGVSMDEVAAKVGIKKPNLFHYYPTKDQLGLAVLERAVRCSREGIVRQFDENGDPIKKIEAMFSDSLDRMEKSCCAKGCFIGNLAQEVSDHNEKLREKVSEHLLFWADRLAAYLDRHRAAGYFRKDLDAKQSAEALISLLEGATLFAKANKRVDALKNARKMAVAYLRTYKA